MCPNCSPQYFPSRRPSANDISPRYGACKHWQFALDDEPVSNVFEATAGSKGSLWAIDSKTKCDCGAGMPEFILATGKVEAYHAAHPRNIVFDDGTETVVTCPTMHLGPYYIYEAPVPPGEQAKKQLDRLLEMAAQLKARVEEATDG